MALLPSGELAPPPILGELGVLGAERRRLKAPA